MNPEIRDKLVLYGELVRINRPIGILLLLWPALWALWFAGEGSPHWFVVVIFVAGTVLMRSAGCAINDYADRDFDGHVERTKQRPLAAGKITPDEALKVFALLSLAAFFLVLFLNAGTILLSFAAVVTAAVYPFMKRYTNLPQLVLGIAFGWAIPMAYMALREEIPLAAWLLFLATVLWALIYDTMYAMADREDDLKIGLKSSAILFGEYDRLIIGVLQGLMIILLMWVGLITGRDVFYVAGISVATILFFYQQWLIREREPKACFQAFLNNNWFGAIVFAGLFLDYLAGS
ncbi:4-hydroxybenzoate octaprenyltransferase [Solemya elarraichensis gill symbiont]|uniref:4-hydroxybenzoate octaprenyltransferase n=1 Tax=Solemya elarraichensis gill symbiont TaxID=1918949 RepID=A0A1T2L5M1_9GAMM|nr:4-hydroxybenzoate octaprenyltransferase [Solemya elarraichensis gill symbiont]OOZ40415.1 4-hydroxybenzoate polyprenyltransferase [Solemya elarraichensis gill symbiont]